MLKVILVFARLRYLVYFFVFTHANHNDEHTGFGFDEFINDANAFFAELDFQKTG